MRPKVDLKFNDINYTAGRQRIIKGISGSFKAGHLTGVMGPSGAGKSTLMNILAGYRTAGVSGQVFVNGEPRRLAVFNKLKVYIMQEDLLQPYMTVKETMLFSARLKLGTAYSEERTERVVDEILETLGLTMCQNMFTSRLSGGQRKRVSVALELVNNPPILFLDEPTTGLDVSAINNTIQLLKLLADQGRTIVCTIHQPSASIFSLFDRVYIMARGKCIYQGLPGQLVPFISDASGLDCPQTHNVADYIFEVLQETVIELMCDSIKNGKIVRNADSTTKTAEQTGEITEDTSEIIKTVDVLTITPFTSEYPNTFWQQFSLLYSRMMLQRRRNKIGLWLQFIHHIVSGVWVGFVFLNVGNDASRPFDNFKFCLCSNIFFMYTHCMIPVLAYPTDIKMMKREYFNRWYSLKPFYLAKTLSTLPFIMLLGVLFLTIVYLLSDQPLELNRFAWFTTYCLLVGITSEGMGVFIGFTFKTTNGAAVGPSTMAFIFVLATYGMGYGVTVHPLMMKILKLSFLRFGLVGIVTALYDEDRKMECANEEEPICLYKDAGLIARDLNMKDEEMAVQLIGLIIHMMFWRALAFFSLLYQCNSEFNTKISTRQSSKNGHEEVILGDTHKTR